ncbi:helix-turn-helix domain-containing protein [Caballeronia sp. LjRoot34]|uniref:helix-turn-helix domain-containing protein n=1 Tax=Caballeronia sp. LjRoot34 TaxID=3342325 RepID=UPI003ED0C4EF
MTRNETAEWTTAGISPADKTDSWQAVVSASYRPWQVRGRLPSSFYAHVRRFEFAGAGFVHAICDPFAGRRTHLDIQRDDELYVGLQLVLEGRERFRIGTNEFEASSGDLVVWTTGRETDFEIVERINKVTLIAPWTLLRDWMPDRTTPPRGGKIDTRSGVGALLASHMRALSQQIDKIELRLIGPVSRPTLELIGIALAESNPPATTDHATTMLVGIQQYILCNLQHCELTPSKIALDNRISLRYLHTLFSRSGSTVTAWILEKRLARCREALANPTFAGQRIADIAYRWGFVSPSHFSRAFKQQFGMSPREFRLGYQRD